MAKETYIRPKRPVYDRDIYTANRQPHRSGRPQKVWECGCVYVYTQRVRTCAWYTHTHTPLCVQSFPARMSKWIYFYFFLVRKLRTKSFELKKKFARNENKRAEASGTSSGFVKGGWGGRGWGMRRMIRSLLKWKKRGQRWLTLQHTATHCNVPQHAATHRSILQHAATCCITLQYPAAHCNILQHTAIHCDTLHYTAIHCNTLHHTATHCNTLRHTAIHCNVLQHTAIHCDTLQYTATHCKYTATHCSALQYTAAHCETLRHTATHCDTLRHTAIHCDTLQRTATHCNALQHTATHCNTLLLRWVWVATISRLLKILGLFCRIESLLLGSFAKKTYNFKEPTNRSHPIMYHARKCIYTHICIITYKWHTHSNTHMLDEQTNVHAYKRHTHIYTYLYTYPRQHAHRTHVTHTLSQMRHSAHASRDECICVCICVCI